MNAAYRQAELFLRIAQRDQRAFVSLAHSLPTEDFPVAFRYDDTLIPLVTPEHARAMVDACIAWCESRVTPP